MEDQESFSFVAMTIPELEEELRQRDAWIKELERQIEELKKLLVEKAESKEAKAPKPAATNFSVDAHERKRREKRSGAVITRGAGNPKIKSGMLRS